MNEQKSLRIAEELESLEATPSTCGVIHQAAFELRRLHQSEREGWRYAKELEQSLKALMDTNARLVSKSLVEACIQEEREACAKLCDELRDEDGFEPYGTECAAAIRARGEA